MMSKREKILLIYCLLKDVRGDWSKMAHERVKIAEKLCKELGGDFDILADECNLFLKIPKDYIDGRFFRADFPNGYLNMEELHGYGDTITLEDKSQEFKEVAKYLQSPYFLFNDVKFSF